MILGKNKKENNCNRLYFTVLKRINYIVFACLLNQSLKVFPAYYHFDVNKI